MSETLRILLIDDSELDAELILNKFSEANILVDYRLVNNTQAIKMQLKEHEWDIILCDYAMPSFNPFEAIKMIQKFNPYLPIIIVSGVIGEEQAVALMRSGCRDCIMKHNMARIPSIVLREFEEAKLRKENLILQNRMSLYHLLADKASDAMLFIDLEGYILEINHAAIALYGYSFEEFLKMNLSDLSIPDDSVLALEQSKTAKEIRDFYETVHYTKKHTPIQVEVSTSRMLLGDHLVLLCIVRDITEKKKAEENFIYMSYHDLLTGLYNRRFFEEELKRLDNLNNLPLSVIMGDINGLKIINDSFGHPVGDEFLQITAEIIQRACRKEDIVCRLGGDDFAIILPKTDSAASQEVMNGISKLALDSKITKPGFSISLGYDIKGTVEQAISEVLINAENDLFRRKLYERSSLRSHTINIIMNTLFAKSSRESNHSERVSDICQAIAAKMDLGTDEIGQLRIAGLVHDIGKIGIDEVILNKAGRLTLDEMNQIKKHPEIGWRILSSVNEFSEVANTIIAHHERWDGSGYPNGLKGEEIPLQTRIISVADAYDVMTSERSYRRRLSVEEAVRELKRCSGSDFDSKIVDVFINEVLPNYRTLASEKTNFA
ncbi:MAG TPA: HD domain-containing phosphohydrolase [Bacillota bacterium]|nr:HD domain-containing phosphohydrolase [Bacillota bacterium]